MTIDFRHGDVANMPFAAELFDFVVCQAAFKNFPDPVAALDEIHRVLRSGGRASIFDLRKDAPREAIDREIRDMHLSALSTLITKWIFRYGLLRAAYTRDPHATPDDGPSPQAVGHERPARKRGGGDEMRCARLHS